MAFGFGPSDFALCAKLAYSIYVGLKDAPRECKAFALEILHLYSLLKSLANDIHSIVEKPEGRSTLVEQQPRLSAHLSRCVQLLLADIAGQKDVPISEDWTAELHLFEITQTSSGTGKTALFASLKRRFSEAHFARKIPRLRRDVAGIVNKLATESVLIIRHKQELAMKSYDRVEKFQAHLMSKLSEPHTCIEKSQKQNMLTASTLQDSQSRIESQIQEILKAQNRHSQCLLSGSLNAASPEGRETWLELGKLLREEGITPKIISKNKRVLIKAMKRTLEDLAVSLGDASYRTALEHQSCSSQARLSLGKSRQAEDSISLFGSAPVQGPNFLSSFQTHFDDLSNDVEYQRNIDRGMSVLMDGMTGTSQNEDIHEPSCGDVDLEQGHDPESPNAWVPSNSNPDTRSVQARFERCARCGTQMRLPINTHGYCEGCIQEAVVCGS